MDAKVILLKTIDNVQVVYYRVLNLDTFETMDIPAYRIMDEIVNNGLNIVNVTCTNNQLHIINEDGYNSIEDVITTDEFDSTVKSLYDWAVDNNDIGSDVLSSYDTEKNRSTPSKIEICSDKELAWTCKNGHTVYCDFATYFSLGCKCPLCEAKKTKDTISLKKWAVITKNKDILNKYESSDQNKLNSDEIEWNSKRMVWMGEEHKKLCEFTSGKK